MKKYLLLFAVAVTTSAQVTVIGGGGGGGGGAVLPNKTGVLAADGTVIDITHDFSVEAAAAAVVDCYTVANVKIPGNSPTITKTHPNATTIRVTFGASQTAGAYCNANATGTGASGAVGAPGVINQVRLNGSNLTQRANLNITGAGATCVDDAGNTETDCAFIGDVAGASALTVAQRLPYVLSAGTLGQTGTISVTNPGTASEAMLIYNTGGATGQILRIGSAQGATSVQQVLSSDGSTVVDQVTSNGSRLNATSVGVNTTTTTNAIMLPTYGFAAANNRGYWWSQNSQAWTTPDTGLERPSAGVIRGVVSPGGARASSEWLNLNISGTATLNAIAGAAIGTSVQAYSANLTGFAAKTPPVGDVVGNSDAQTLTNKTLTSPVINTPTIPGTEWNNANHTHTSNSSGGQFTDAALSTAVTVPKGGTGAVSLTGVLKGNGTSAITEVTGLPTDCVRVDGTSGACGGGGGADLITEIESVSVGQRPRLSFDQGTGVLISGVDDGSTRVSLEISANTAVLQTRTNDQSNADRVVTLSSSNCTFVGTLSPALIGYPAAGGMIILLPVNASCAQTGTLALNGLAAKNLYESNGTTPISTTAGYSEMLVWDPSLNTGAGGWKRLGRIMTSPVVYLAAICQGTAASLGFSAPVTDPAVAACVAGTNTHIGVAQFADGANALSVQGHFPIPTDAAGAFDIRGTWRTSATAGSVVWQVQTACVGDGQTTDPSWNAATAITDAANGTTQQQNDFSSAAINITGCAAGEEFYFKFLRDPAHASDSLAATAELISLTFITRRAI